jgi:hypothetical protein
MLRKISVLVVIILGITVVNSSVLRRPRISTHADRQCTSERGARSQAENIVLPSYPEEAKAEGNQGVVWAMVLFDQEGKLAKTRFLETPHPLLAEAVGHALEEWKLKRLYNSGLEPIETQTAVRFHFIFENGQGRVETATDEEQKEFGGEWGKRVCDRSAFDK